MAKHQHTRTIVVLIVASLLSLPALAGPQGSAQDEMTVPMIFPVLGKVNWVDTFNPDGLGGRRMAIVQDRQCGTFVGVLAVRASGFALVGGEEQRRRLDAWAAVLSGLAREGTLVHRAQWVLRVVPGDADDLLRHVEAAGSPGAPADATASYRELVEGAGPATQRHEAFLALAVHRRRVRSRGDASGAPEVVWYERTERIEARR